MMSRCHAHTAQHSSRCEVEVYELLTSPIPYQVSHSTVVFQQTWPSMEPKVMHHHGSMRKTTRGEKDEAGLAVNGQS